MFDEKEPKTRKTKPKLQSKARNTNPGHVHRNPGHDAGISGHVHRNTQLWSGDITYIATDEGWLYLAAVIDLFNRQVVGWSMQPHMQTSLVKDALTMAWFRRRPEAGLIFHSDRGSQYCSHDFQDAMREWQMRSSMSRKGNCWDNAPTESFWGRLKTASLYGKKFATRREAMDAVLDWMAFYNHRRLHSTLGYLSPMQYEQRWYAAQRKKAA
jgi:transposase InsO family protein